MEVKKILKDKVFFEEEIRIKFTPEDIEYMIRNHLHKLDYDTENLKISFNTTHKYVKDEWGMNGHWTSEFLGVQAKL